MHLSILLSEVNEMLRNFLGFAVLLTSTSALATLPKEVKDRFVDLGASKFCELKDLSLRVTQGFFGINAAGEIVGASGVKAVNAYARQNLQLFLAISKEGKATIVDFRYLESDKLPAEKQKVLQKNGEFLKGAEVAKNWQLRKVDAVTGATKFQEIVAVGASGLVKSLFEGIDQQKTTCKIEPM